MKKVIIACILTALLLTGCALHPVQPDIVVDGAISPQAPTEPQTTSKEITEDEAKEIAIAHAGVSADQVTFVKSGFDWDDGRKTYDVEFYTKDFKEYDYEINPNTGEVVDFDYDAEYYAPPADTASATGTESSGTITEDEAKAIAIARVPGATVSDIREFRTDRDDGRLEYEGKVYYDRTEYEFEIDGANGEILSWEVESFFD